MVVIGPALAAVVGLGAVGGILANIALTPLTAGASVLQSYWYGAGLILGERMMYTVHWEKIKERLDKGESFISVLDPIMNDDITAIANLSFKAMEQTGDLYLKAASSSIGAFIEKLLLAMLTANPTGIFNGGGEEEGSGTEENTQTGISLTVAEIQAWDDNKLLFENQPNQITKYNAFTQGAIKAEIQNRNLLTTTKEDEFSVPTTEIERLILQPSETSLQNGFVFPATMDVNTQSAPLEFPRQVLTSQRLGTDSHKAALRPYMLALNAELNNALRVWNEVNDPARIGFHTQDKIRYDNHYSRVKILQQWIWDWNWLYQLT